MAQQTFKRHARRVPESKCLGPPGCQQFASRVKHATHSRACPSIGPDACRTLESLPASGPPHCTGLESTATIRFLPCAAGAASPLAAATVSSARLPERPSRPRKAVAVPGLSALSNRGRWPGVGRSWWQRENCGTKVWQSRRCLVALVAIGAGRGAFPVVVVSWRGVMWVSRTPDHACGTTN